MHEHTSSSSPSGGREPDETLAARFEISFDGKRYTFRQYHYDRFEDALRYAAAEQAKAGFQRDGSFRPGWMPAYRPGGADEELMRRHGIVYDAGSYLYGGYRYGQLCDAAAYASAHPIL